VTVVEYSSAWRDMSDIPRSCLHSKPENSRIPLKGNNTYVERRMISVAFPALNITAAGI
jgi:hypothetical protein